MTPINGVWLRPWPTTCGKTMRPLLQGLSYMAMMLFGVSGSSKPQLIQFFLIFFFPSLYCHEILDATTE